MRLPTVRRAFTLVATLALVAAGAAGVGARGASSPAERSAVTAVVHHYRMSARIRPLLLFWIGRDDVGGARVAWQRPDAGSLGIELLIGSDPGKAPRHINRWGYLREEAGPDETRLVGLMKASDEDSLEAAEEGVERDAAGDVHVFKAIRATVTPRQSRSVVTLLPVEADPTFRQAGDLLARLAAAPAPASARTLDLPPGTRPGFLLSVAELLHDATAAAADGAVRASDLPALTYVYHGKLYRLHARRVQPERDPKKAGPAGDGALRADFESSRLDGSDRARFALVFGTRGDLAEVPVNIVYRPRWWLEVELTLDDHTAF